MEFVAHFGYIPHPLSVLHLSEFLVHNLNFSSLTTIGCPWHNYVYGMVAFKISCAQMLKGCSNFKFSKVVQISNSQGLFRFQKYFKIAIGGI